MSTNPKGFSIFEMEDMIKPDTVETMFQERDSCKDAS